MKILIGVLLALLVGLGLAGWQLKESWAREATVREQLAGVEGQLATSEKQNAALAGRFDSLDAALKGLNAAQQQNQTELKGRLAAIKNIVQEPSDDPASIACLHRPVPAQLDRGLREPAAGR